MLSDAETLVLNTVVDAEFARTIAQNPRSTVKAPSLAADVAKAPPAVRAGLELGALLGEGGMGIVHRATQLSLGRGVAVKTLRPASATSDEATLRLLREAWVTGALEHPNIVPVYDLGLDPQGVPFIVLKEIEGRPWSDVISDPVAIKERFGVDDLFEQNLRILVQVCHAVGLAHARGIVHRDLKPENVMIGRFGEVYLVDWGLGVSLKDDPTGRLPLATDATHFAGTPAYMAPEMLGGLGPLTERTDVYLLGAILFEILVGRAPHHGDDLRQLVASILLSTPQFPPGVPKELATIAARAMSRLPEERYASVTELRDRLEWYLRHRGSLALSAEAAARVDALRSLLGSGQEAGGLPDRVHHLFAEARFGFRQAIRACDDNAGARVGLREVTEMVVAFELERGAAEAAAAALAELHEPPPELASRVSTAMQRREAEKARMADLEKLSADMDPSVGRQTRVSATVLMSLAWILAPQAFAWFDLRYPDRPYRIAFGGAVFILLFGTGILLWGRKAFGKTEFNRRTRNTVVMAYGLHLVMELGSHLLGLPRASLMPLHVYSWAAAAVAFAVLVEARFAFSAVGCVIAFVVACKWPDQAWNLLSFQAAIVTINAFALWSRPSDGGKHVADSAR